MAAAEAQAAAVKKDAEQRIAAEIQRARVELAREVSLAATAAAEKLLRDKATAADHTKLIDTFVKDVEQAATGRQGAV
jgi:F0F1-type ATP synthase membrane subunit b/b'